MNVARPLIRDLGELDLPLAVFGGPYSNLQATERLKGELEAQGLVPSRIICTGDIVAYCGEPVETVELIRDWGIHCIQGNVEIQLACGSDDCGCNFTEGSVCDALSASWYAYARKVMQPDHLQWMGDLPAQITFRAAGLTFRVIHGGANDISRFIFASTPWEEKQKELEVVGADVILSGHCGIPFSQNVGGAAWINAGVIGMPPNDGQPQLWYATLEKREDHLLVRHHTLSYDHESASGIMRKNGLPAAYAQSLLTGLWPSLDILPEAERQQQGVPLHLAPLTIPLR